MDDASMTAPPLAGELLIFDLDEQNQWDRYKELNAEALDADIEVIRMTYPEEYVEAAIQDFWHYVRESHRQEVWTSGGWATSVFGHSTHDDRASEPVDLEAENAELRAELEDRDLKLVEKDSEIRRLKEKLNQKDEEGDRGYEREQRLEAKVARLQNPPPCPNCGYESASRDY